MKKILNYDLEYVEKGEEKIKVLSIKLVSQRVQREFGEIMDIIRGAELNFEKVNLLSIEISSLKELKIDGYKEKIKDIKKDVEKLTEEMKEIGSDEYYKNRFKTVKRILVDNGYEDDPICNYEFWDEKITPSVFIEFLMRCYNKDMDTKTAKK